MNVLCRPGVAIRQEWTAPADAQPSQSAKVWEESEFKDACPRLAQSRPADATEERPALLPVEPSTSLWQELDELARSFDQAKLGAECPEEIFLPLFLQRGGQKRRGEHEPRAHGLPARSCPRSGPWRRRERGHSGSPAGVNHARRAGYDSSDRAHVSELYRTTASLRNRLR